MRSRFDAELQILNKEMIAMGALCEEAIAVVAKSLTAGDAAAPEKIAPLEAEIDRKEREIETLCLKLLLRQQPVARDLRQISSALKMITDLERIGDQAMDIAEIVSFMGGSTPDDCTGINEMARAVIKMLTESLDAFVKRDGALADAMIAHDDVVDALFVDVKKELIEMIMAHPDKGEYALDLLMIAKYFERIGDHAVNVAEWVAFSVTGVHKGEIEL